MTCVSPFTAEQAIWLDRFLGAPERPHSTFGYPELAGFLFAVACGPQLIPPSLWLPPIFNEADPAYADPEEAQQFLAAALALHNGYSSEDPNAPVALPPGCEPAPDPLANFGPQGQLGQWSRGFLIGREWLREIWAALLPEELETRFLSACLVAGFFASREKAETVRAHLRHAPVSLGEMAAANLARLPDAMNEYALIGRAIRKVQQGALPSAPANSAKVGRNDPCPCGSGKKYKKCCNYSPPRNRHSREGGNPSDK